MSKKRVGPLVAAGVAALAVGLPAAAQASVVAEDTRPQALAAYGGVLMWSDFDERTKRYRLMVRRGGKVVRMAVRPSEQPFEVDLGPGVSEPVVAVYSRCDRRDCDLFQYSFRARSGRRLAFAASPARTEMAPAIWRDRVAFASVINAKRKRYSGQLMVARRGHVRRLPGGRRSDEDGYTGPGSIDIRGRRLAVEWVSQVLDCPDPMGEDGEKEPNDEFEPPQITQLWTYQGTERRLLDNGCDEDEGTHGVEHAVATPDGIAYQRLTKFGSQLRIVTPGGRTLAEGPLRRTSWWDMALDSDRVYYVEDTRPGRPVGRFIVGSVARPG